MAKTNGMEIVWHHCNLCLGDKKHSVLFERKNSETDTVEGGYAITWTTTTSVLECGGCASLLLRKTVYCDEDGNTRTTVFPPAISRQKPVWHNQLPAEYRALLSELYSALHADSRALALMGARALIDIFIVKKIGDKGSFNEKLSKLKSDGFITESDFEILSSALDAGSAASHRGYYPSPENAACVLDIVENLLHKEVLTSAALRLKETTPQRIKKS